MGLLFFTAVQAQPIIRDSSTRYYFRDHEMIPDSIDKKWIIDNMPEPLEPVTKYIKYPEEAHRTNLEGKVILLGLVGENGLVTRTMIESSTDSIFNEPAREALFRVRFKPALQEGKPIKVWYRLPVNFRIPK